MGILDGIGLVVLILFTVAFCSYCYRCCCIPHPSRTNTRPRRNRRQKNARRKRRRCQRSTRTTPNRANNPPNPQCTINLFPDEQPQVLHSPYPSGQPFQGHPYSPHPYYPYSPHYPVNSPSDHGILLPPPYESHQSPQSQSFGASMEPDLSCFSHVLPPPPYDTCAAEPVPTNRQCGDTDMKC